MPVHIFKLSFIYFLFTGSAAFAQLNIQSGATFHMQPGAIVTVEGSLDNAGTLNNDGTLRVRGHYVNSGNYTGTGTAGILEMYGSGNANLAAGASQIPNLVINKSNATDMVKLTASATVNTSLTHTNGIFTTDPIANPSFTLIAPVAATFNFAAGKEIVGRVQRTGWTNGVARVFNQPNMQLTTNGGTAPTDVTVIMIPEIGGGNPTQAEREVTRKFNFLQSGGSAFTTDIRYPYASSELNNNIEANLVPWTLVSGEWNARLTPISRDLVNDFVSTTGITATAFTQEWKLADPNYTFNATAYIKGAWNNPTGLMRVTLNSNGLLPSAQPYSGTPYSYPGTESANPIPNANIVDWVLLELRKPVSGLAADANTGTIIGRKAVFLLNNGTLVGLDGETPARFDITKQGTGNYIVVRHRNHLAVMSNTKASNATGDFTNNFSLFSDVFEKPGATSQAITLLSSSGAGSTLYGLWPGDVNANGSVTNSDVTPINTAISGPLSGNSNVYNVRDANLDRNITNADVSITNTSIAGFAQTSNSARAGDKGVIVNIPSDKKGPVTHVPNENN